MGLIQTPAEINMYERASIFICFTTIIIFAVVIWAIIYMSEKIWVSF